MAGEDPQKSGWPAWMDWGGRGFLPRLQETAVGLRQQARVFEQRRINRLRAGQFAEEREQIVAPLAFKELHEADADAEINDTERNQLFVSDGCALLERHVAHDQAEEQEQDPASSDQDDLPEEPAQHEGPKPHQPAGQEEEPVYTSEDHDFAPKDFTHKLRWVLEHRYFTYAVSVVVVVNAIFIFIDEEQQSSANLGQPWSQTSTTLLVVIDVVFDILFCLEVGLRLAMERLAFFCQPWNFLDFVLVSVALIGKATRLIFSADPASARWFRVFRLGRLFWLLHLFESLWIIIVGVISAMRTIVWAFILLFIIIYVFGILSTRMLGQPLLSRDSSRLDPADADSLRIWFGGIPQSMFTLLTMMTMEGWAEIVRTVAQYQEGFEAILFYLFFFLFFSLTTWGLMNMVVAVIIDATVGKALHHLENYVKVTAAERHEAIKKICDCFFLTGVDSEGSLSKAQFLESLEDKNFVNMLHDVGIDARQAHTLFDLLDFDRSGTLSITEFCEGVLEARGKGHSMDVLRLKYDLQRAHERSQKSAESLRQDFRAAADELLAETRALRAALPLLAPGCGNAQPE